MAVKMPVISHTIKFDDQGYEGWYVKMRLNLTAFDYDNFISPIPEKEWEGLKKAVLEWNFVDDDNTPIPLPKDWKTYDTRKKLTYKVWNTMLQEYFDEFNRPARLPKDSSVSSDSTSTPNGRVEVPVA